MLTIIFFTITFLFTITLGVMDIRNGSKEFHQLQTLANFKN